MKALINGRPNYEDAKVANICLLNVGQHEQKNKNPAVSIIDPVKI